MTKARCLQFVVIAFVVTFCFGQLATAEMPHSHMIVVPRAHSQIRPNTGGTGIPAAGLYAVTQGFFNTPYPNWNNNSDGYELWPCFADTANSSSPTPGPNPDCQYIGTPQIAFQSGGGAFGTAGYSWPLQTTSQYGITSYGCDGSTNGTQNPYTQGETWDPASIDGFYIPCGQINTWYEDWSNDSADDILWSAVVTQGTSVIADTGIQDWGPNTYAATAAPPPIDVIFYQDFNFGALGQTGKNNGNCVPNFNYPTSTAGIATLSYPVITAANKTCVDPVPGPATISVTTEIATPAWTCKTTKGVTTCTVKYTKKYSVAQKWNINLYEIPVGSE